VIDVSQPIAPPLSAHTRSAPYKAGTTMLTVSRGNAAAESSPPLHRHLTDIGLLAGTKTRSEHVPQLSIAGAVHWNFALMGIRMGLGLGFMVAHPT